MAVKAILKGCHLVHATNVLSRHATPQKGCHMFFHGPTARAAYNAIDPAAAGLWVAHHPALGNALPAQWLSPDGGMPHAILGVTDRHPAKDANVTTWERRRVIELYVRGHILRWINGRTRAGNPFCAVAMTAPTLLNALKASAVIFRSDTGVWADVPNAYKRPNGQPRFDPDDGEAASTVVL